MLDLVEFIYPKFGAQVSVQGLLHKNDLIISSLGIAGVHIFDLNIFITKTYVLRAFIILNYYSELLRFQGYFT